MTPLRRPGVHAGVAAGGVLLVAAVVATGPWFGGEGGTPALDRAAASAAANDTSHAFGARTLREAIDELARRHGVRIVLDAAVPADGPAPPVAEGLLSGVLLESTLRELLAGHELLFHHGRDAHDGSERLLAVYAYARGDARLADGPALAALVATPAAGDSPAAAGGPAAPAPGAAPAEATEPDAHTLHHAALSDESGAARLAALDAYLLHPDADGAEAERLLDRLASDADPLVAEQARAMRDARLAIAVDVPPADEQQ